MGVLIVEMMSTIIAGVSIVPGLVIAMSNAQTQVVVITITPLFVSGIPREPESMTTISGWVTGGVVIPELATMTPGSDILTSIDPVITILVSTVPVLAHITTIGGSSGTGDHIPIFPDAVVPVLVVNVSVLMIAIVVPPVELLFCESVKLVPVNLTSQLTILD